VAEEVDRCTAKQTLVRVDDEAVLLKQGEDSCQMLLMSRLIRAGHQNVVQIDECERQPAQN
jgi:aryl carrier-like protein